MLKRLSLSRKPADPSVNKKATAAPTIPETTATPPASTEAPHEPQVAPKDVPLPSSSPEVASSPKPATATDIPARPVTEKRPLSLRAFLFVGSKSPEQENKPVTPAQPKPPTSSDKRAQESALIVRSLIVGPAQDPGKVVAPAQVNKVKSQLMEPKSANKIIAALRALPGWTYGVGDTAGAAVVQPHGPIHAVCLPYTEQEAHDLHFSQLVKPLVEGEEQASSSVPSVASASIESLSEMLKNMKVVNLITAPDLGLGQPGDGEGLLSGAVPTAETVINGIVQVTPELMALGFATGKILIPNHAGGFFI
jgi:hypothetical protein